MGDNLLGMEHYSDENSKCSYHFVKASIRFQPIATDISQSSTFMLGLDTDTASFSCEEVTVISGRFLPRRSYTFIGCCSLRRPSSKRSSPHLPGQGESHEIGNSIDNDMELSNSDLLVGLQFSSGLLSSRQRSYMQCHFDNHPDAGWDRSVMIALKFNDIRAVIRAHGYLDGCSQFVKVDLGFGDRGDASGKRFSTVLTSTFPRKPTHPDQCFLWGRLCSLTELESVVGVVKSEMKLKFLEGHVSVTIYAGDYWNESAPEQCSILHTCPDDYDYHVRTDLFEGRGLETKARIGVDVYIMSSDKRKFPCQRDAIEAKSRHLHELIKIHGIAEGSSVVFSMEKFSSDIVENLVSYIMESTYSHNLSCPTAVGLIEAALLYKIHQLEALVCHTLLTQTDSQWYDAESLIKLFLLCRNHEGWENRDKLKFRIVQAFKMKRRAENGTDAVSQLFFSYPDAAADLLLEALTVCSG